ncbi:MAG: TPM domain-containing protein [Verrucomicrobiales bacterium]|nr:TPM domain-containing protein [Verrucomicrobiales bacterium]
MRCPSCQRPVDHEAESCYSCGYSAIESMKRFGSNQVKMRRVHDAADCLRVKDSEMIERTLNRLEKRFPQLVFAVYLGDLNETISIGELGFWLLNQVTIEGAGYAKTNESAVLLVVDVNFKKAGLSLGYFTEMLLGEEDCLRALAAGRSHFANGEFGTGVVDLFTKVEKSLIKQAKKMKGLSREEKQSVMMRNHHGPNILKIPGSVRPFDRHPVPETEQPHLLFRNEFEENWK